MLLSKPMRYSILASVPFILSFLVLFNASKRFVGRLEDKLSIRETQNVGTFHLPSMKKYKSNEREFCNTIMANPKPCMFRIKDFHCGGETDGRAVMFSSNQQDYYLYTRHFKYIRRPGVYFDIASNHPIAVSNTFFFDRCLGWKGICFEANDVYFEPLFSERSCVLVPTCISKTDGQIVDFRPYGQRGGVLGENYKFSDSFKNARNNISKSLKCTTVSKVTERFAVNMIDYLSLDVEGHELEVLMGIDWERTNVGVITVERGPRFANISSYLGSKGFLIHNISDIDYEKSNYPKFTLTSDDIFIHKSISFGSPV